MALLSIPPSSLLPGFIPPLGHETRAGKGAGVEEEQEEDIFSRRALPRRQERERRKSMCARPRARGRRGSPGPYECARSSKCLHLARVDPILPY